MAESVQLERMATPHASPARESTANCNVQCGIDLRRRRWLRKPNRGDTLAPQIISRMLVGEHTSIGFRRALTALVPWWLPRMNGSR